MTPRRSPGELEQLLLLTVLRLEGDAHGPAIRRELRARGGRDVGPGTLYPTLDRLQNKGLLTSRLGEPTPDRGGRAKRYFRLTPEGLAQARSAWRTMARLAEGLEGRLGPEGG